MPVTVRHIPVMARRCVELLAPTVSDGGIIVDATLGMGGHSEAILKALPNAQVIGIDRDPDAIAMASERLAPFGDRFTAVHTTYDDFDGVASVPLAGVLMDLGVSSYQLDERERGFSYAVDAPLDMRMDTTEGTSAADLLALSSEEELRSIIYRYGEEKFAPRIARAIVARRKQSPLTRTGELADLIRDAIPAPARRKGGNPSKRTFQALRIAVNRELDILERALPAALDALRVSGRMVVMAYHSLEDRMVKRAFQARTTSSAPHGLPELPEHAPTFTQLTRGAEKASETEIAENPRAASVRLRAVERVMPTLRRTQ